MRRTELVEKRDMLLFDILEELKALRADLSVLNVNSDKLSITEEKSEPQPIREAEQQSKLILCKHCGDYHAKNIEVVNCGKRKNKKG